MLATSTASPASADQKALSLRVVSSAATSSGSNQVPERSAATSSAAVAPPWAKDDLGDLRQAHDPRRERDLGAAEAVRHAVAVPALVERADGVRGAARQVDHAGDLGAALTARGVELVLEVLGARDLGEAAHARQQRRVGERAAERRGGLCAQRVAVGALPALLVGEVVGAEQRAHGGRVGRAARVLEQQPVVERGPFRVRHARHRGDPHADRARTGGVAGGLALGHVERERQGRDDLGEADLHHHGDRPLPVGLKWAQLPLALTYVQ